MKYRITEWLNGAGERHWTLDVKHFGIWWSLAASHQMGFADERFPTRERALEAIDSHIERTKRKFISKVTVEIIER